MANKPASDAEKDNRDVARLALAELSWKPIDDETSAGQHGLTPLLLHRFGHRIAGLERTVAQVLVDRLLERALDGHHQSFEEIMIRIDGDVKSIGPAVRSTPSSIKIDQTTAQRVLDALHVPDQDLAGY
jgi:hypothetical protein